MRPWLLAIAIVVGCGSDGGGGGDDTQPPPGNDAAGTPDSPAGTPDGTTPSCAGGCPTGYSCASANEIPVCRNDATGIPLFSHIFVVWMENTSHDTLMSSDNTPYLHGLFSTTAYSTNYTASPTRACRTTWPRPRAPTSASPATASPAARAARP